MDIKDYAPVLVTTLNRYGHFKRCIESLSKCTHAEKTELVIGVDYPPSEKYKEGWKQICEFVPNIKGFKKVTVFYRETNFGAGPNNVALKKYAREQYNSFIFTEDDNEFSPNFLDYMNKALAAFEDNPKVFGICGYNYAQIDMAGYEKEYYYSHEMSAWGWGSWFNDKCDKIQTEIRTPGYLMKLIKNVPFKTFISNGAKRCKLLYEVGKGFTGDGYYTYYEWNNDMYCVFPTLSLVRNIGHDGSGAHCNPIENDIFATQTIDDKKTFDSNFDLPVVYNDIIRKKFNSFQAGDYRDKIKKILLLILMKMFVELRGY